MNLTEQELSQAMSDAITLYNDYRTRASRTDAGEKVARRLAIQDTINQIKDTPDHDSDRRTARGH